MTDTTVAPIFNGSITDGEGGMMFSGPDATALYRLTVMKAAVRLEARGMRASRRVNVTAQARKELGLSSRAPHGVVMAAIQDKINYGRVALAQSRVAAAGDSFVASVLTAIHNKTCARLLTSSFVTFEHEGEDCIFTPELKAHCEKVCGMELDERVLPGLEGQATICPVGGGA